MADLREVLDKLLAQVQKPARYLGNEWNAVHKEHDSVAVRAVIAFPDLYEVGMSNLGWKVLYEAVNREEDLLLERVFAPAGDMEALMRRWGVPLFALESARPVKEFDVLGFSLQYELSYTNVLNMLDLAGLPLYSSRRQEGPLIIGGGPCAFNPEPLAPFFDLFLLGDGEEALPELLRAWAELTREHSGNRREILAALSRREGVYVPSLYRPLYRGKVFQGMERLDERAPERVRKRVVRDLDRAPFPCAPIVPYTGIVHDRAALELFRGCGRGCRFCQAGIVYRPVRRRSPERLKEMARELLQATGYEELSLVSLSSSDYPEIDALVRDLAAESPVEKLRISLPSLRLDAFSGALADQIRQERRGSLTFAPEAGTERLRRIIRKEIDEGDLYRAVGSAVEAGWKQFKFYFMIGLPGETERDVEGIADLVRRLLDHFAGKKERLRISVSVATFVPKPHTPFQWEPQLELSRVKERQRLLKAAFKGLRSVELSYHDAEASFLEAVFARGDRLLAPVLERAWRSGCRFDGWTEQFSLERWRAAFQEEKIHPESYAYRRYAYEEPLPWDHLSPGVKKEALLREHRRAWEEAQRHGGE
ncbi:MAG TPA: TIGR03960 family B12-binding radical SAM protein [Bacillota bacterium]|nr:TIGR03960 family B12-binding radical SAM protein [Bacillota bacterium]HOB87079.1 TIGR03960 family B12-binding radical SAM protein [Bacillota bacterium]HOP69668.1 TIGR03960 family B12-binding radical SAM protein [Bacillota bacterium]HPT34549.1 TIGR03960 family B12-binding radical SAM protein [Bacillota bacterium]HQD06537.1 TIGR03960 family B12-binding radical SAM protein [Bacillota bacterium]